MKMLVLLVICSCDLGQQSSNHFYDIRDRHFRYFILWSAICAVLSRQARTSLGERVLLIENKALNVRQALDFDFRRRRHRRC